MLGKAEQPDVGLLPHRAAAAALRDDEFGKFGRVLQLLVGLQRQRLAAAWAVKG